MMKKLILLASVLCMSAQIASPTNQELAMTKCSKPAQPASDDKSKSDSDSDMDDNTSKAEAQKKAAQMKGKSAARKVIEGLSDTTMNGERKSAAKRSMEAVD